MSNRWLACVVLVASLGIVRTADANITVQTPSSVPFNEVRLAAGQTGNVTVTVRNNDMAASVAVTASLTGADPGEFVITSTAMQTIPMNGTRTWTVAFKPTSLGIKNATLSFADGGGGASIPLSGTATAAILSTTDLTLTAPNTTGAAGTVTVKNDSSGPGTLSISRLDLAQTSGWFKLDSCGSATTCTVNIPLGPLATTTIPIHCTPPANTPAGQATATLTVTSDSDTQTDRTAMITCNSVPPIAAASFTSPGDANLGSSSSSTLTVTNSGPPAGVLTYNAVIGGADASAFTFDGGCNANCTMAGGAMRTAIVKFTPTAARTYTATLTVTTDDPAHPMFTFAMSAAGNGAVATITPTSLAFTTDINVASASMPVTVRNTGNQNLVISSAALVTGIGDYIVVNPASLTLLPGDMVNFAISCKPTTPGAHPGVFQIDSNATNLMSQQIALSCTGLKGDIAPTPADYNFNGVSMGSGPVTHPITITNTGNTQVRGLTATIVPADKGFTVAPPTPAALEAGATASVVVSFAPVALTDGGDATVTVRGTWGSGANSVPVMTTFTVHGQSLTNGFTTTQMIDFGNQRYTATSAPMQVCFTQTGAAPVTLHGITITYEAGMSGDLELTNFKSTTSCGTAGTPIGGNPLVDPIALGGQNKSIVADVVWKNHDMFLGAFMASIVVHTDEQGTRQVMVKGVSTSGELTLSDPMYDFGAVDIQGGPITKTFTVTNTGDADMDVSAFTGMGASTSFTTTATTDLTTLAPGATRQFDVTYHPTVINPSDTPETYQVNFAVTGVLGASSMMTRFLFQGRGIDRTFSIAAAPTFSTTYRNPGSAAPEGTVVIHNGGEAPLHISMLMLGDASWKLKDPNMTDFSIAGGMDGVITLLFTPTKIGTNTGTLVITNDATDTAPYETQAIVPLSGLAMTRDVMFTTGPLSLGTTGTNFPVVMPGQLKVKNMSATQTFTISRLEVQGAGGAIQIMGETTNIVLAANEERTFDVRFAPATAGQYNATVVMYLDEDPTPHATLDLAGGAVFVEAQGGGGCSVGGDGRGAGASGLLALGILGLVRRRRRRSSVLTAAIVLAGGGVAAADDLTLSAFTPTPETKPSNFQVQSGEVGENGDWVASAVMSVATDPLLHLSVNSTGEPVEQDVIARSMVLQLGGAYAFLDRWEVGAHMPLYTQSGDEADASSSFMPAPISGSARGDLVVHGKFKLARKPLEGKGYLAAAANLQVTLPTATDGAFTGVKYPTARAQLLATLMPGAFSNRLTLSANAGALLQGTSEYANLEQKSGVVWGIGMQIRALDKVWADGEMYGTFMPSSKTDAMGTTVALSPIEWLLGVKIKPDHRFAIGIAGGRGLTSAVGTPALRAVLSLTVTPKAEKLGPIHPPPPPKPDLDDDNDGLKSSIDQCDDQPEDKDGFEDQDGCPDEDNDGDGVADGVDKCVNEPEDLDKFEDLDGCPDLDNDKDGVNDSADKCPLVAEDKDGFQDEDGCPETDNDGDGIPDDRDACPLKPETVNGNKDDDGCPDKGMSLVAVSTDRLDTLETIQFSSNSGKLTSKSNNILAQVAATLRAHPEVVKLRVTCHVNPSSNPQRDQQLSDERAAAVRDWLVNWGIAAARIDTRGFGGSKPLAKPGTKGAAGFNDRVELIILERN